MRDLIAAIIAILLIGVALSLMTTLRAYRRRQQAVRGAEIERGRTIIAELPTASGLKLFSADEASYYDGARSIEKEQIVAVRVLINGSPIAAYVSRRHPAAEDRQPMTFEDRPEGIARDRWDVAIETPSATVLVECGAIRERVSQELARKIFDAVKADLERRDGS